MLSENARVLVVGDEHIIADTLVLIVSHRGHEALAIYGGLEAIYTASWLLDARFIQHRWQ